MIGKILRRLKTLPSGWIARICEKLHDKYWTSAKKTTPSTVKLSQIIKFLNVSGVCRGDTLFIHSSWECLNSGSFSAVELIEALIDYLGKHGTLAMPAFPPEKLQVNETLFDGKRLPSGGGLLTEVFRRYPGVRRSINLNHSVCAAGPNAAYLTESHHLSKTSWDKHSPYYRLRDFENAFIVGFGVGHRLRVATSLHCVESVLQSEIEFFKKIFREEVRYNYFNADGKITQHKFRKRYGEIYTPKIAKYFSEDILLEDTLSGLEVYSINAKKLIDTAVTLGREGKTMYVWPIPFQWRFKRTRK